MRDEAGRFLPGESGNPAGRPLKGDALTDVLRNKVDKDAVAAKLIEMAMERNDLGALKYIYDRLDGKPVETINQNVLSAPKVVEIVHRGEGDGESVAEDIEAMEES